MRQPDKAVTLAKLGLAIFPVRPRPEGTKPAKTPIPFNGHLAATTDLDAIRKWWADYPEALVGVNAGASKLVALDIDMDADADHPKDGWFSIGSAGLDIPDTYNYETRRGGSHYVYAAPEGVSLGPTQDHVTPTGEKLEDVDRRAGSSYFIWWPDRVPESRGEFKQPPSWLLTPSAPAERNPYSGSSKDWLERCVPGEPSPMVQAWISEIPRDFGHQEMIEAQRLLVGWAVEGEAGIPFALDSLRNAWLAGEWGTNKYRRDWDAGLKGAIEQFGAFPTGPRDIGRSDEYVEHVNVIDAEGWLDVYTGLPASQSKEAMRERVTYIASICLEHGLSTLDVANVAWHSKAARESIRKHLPEDQAKVELWNVVIEALSKPISGETPAPEAKSPAPKKRTEEERRVALLTDRERSAINSIRSSFWSGDIRWWGDQFMNVMIANHPVLSEPYYRLNRWLILSLAFANAVSIQTQSGTNYLLNFYMIALGPSNSGKSEALEPVLEFARAWSEMMGLDNPDIGGDATAAALSQALIRRDGQVSLFHSDEADAILLNWSDQKGPFSGMKQRITEIYSGRVPAVQRAMQKDISGIHAKAYLLVHLIGIDDRITDAIEPDDWRSGFINRFIWTKGERKHRTDEMRRIRLRRPGELPAKNNGHQTWTLEWANRFRRTVGKYNREPGAGIAAYEFSEDVLQRHVETDKTFDRLAAETGPYADRVAPTFERYKVYVLKCAALVALSEGRDMVVMSDYLIALEQMEEWAETALEMVEATDLSPRARRVNRLADLIASRGGVMTKSEIYREKAYAGDSRDVDGLIKELEAQRRIEILQGHAAEPMVRILKEAA